MVRAGKLREPDVSPLMGRLGSWVDCLAGKYSQMAESSSGKKKEAAALISLAEGHMGSEDLAEATKASKDAVAMFKEVGDKAATADAERMYAHALCCGGKGAEALEMAKEAMEGYKSSGAKLAQGKLLLSMAEAGLEGDVESAVASATEALSIFRSEGDKTMVAAAQVLMSTLCLKKKGEAKKKADEAKQACDEALPVFRDTGDAKAEAYAMHCTAAARAAGGSVEGALRAAKEAQALYQKLEMRKQEAFELHAIAVYSLMDGSVEDASDAAEEALDIFGDDLHASGAEACVMQTLVAAYIEDKEPRDALELAKAEMERFQDAGNSTGVAAAEEMLMMAYIAMGNVDRGMRYAQRAAETLEAAGDKKGQAKVLRSMCAMYKSRDEHDKALKSAQDALTIFEELEDMKEQAITLQFRADVYLEKKENGRALALASEARELFQDAQEVEGEVSALLQLSSAQFADGDHKKAAASAKEAQEKCGEVQDQSSEAAALRTLINVNIAEKEYDQALKSLGSLLSVVKELGDREEEVTTMVTTVHVILRQFVERDEDGKGSDKLHKSTADKTSKMAKDALAVARKLDAPDVLAAGLFTVAQTQMMNGRIPEAKKAADEALDVFRGTGSVQGEAATLILLADINSFNQEFGRARELAEEGVYLYQQVGDVEGEDWGWNQLERIEKIEAEIRERQMQQQQAWQMQQAAQMMQGQNLQPIPQEYYEEAAPSAAAGGGYEAKLAKLDISAGLDPVMLKNQILEVTKGLIGYDEEIEFDAPLMESGLTSNTAVLLRDSLTQQLPGVNLPVTLVFDYPSIQAMSELIVENAAKAAKKAAKAALKG